MLGQTSLGYRLAMLGVLAAFVELAQTDSTRRVRGYAGVLPIPPSADADDMPGAPDILVDRRVSVRGEKGRVLYANERVTVTAESDARGDAPRSRRTCSQVVQSRTAASPTT